ncbi:alpha/beta hydrolase [Gloeothece verrucosa]|uniref:Dienelactone hydrolase n=1 Tax=Gloeothece verrucosa (strain PCC 7822) TaxID=497965 RepID=E0UAR4_GLOV7|nr:alpha/beta hydrolase [Gloeothece verrucosa]ADN13916.1 conserved hypothetical protein [Gloeothece verrucosa PCC 7822]
MIVTSIVRAARVESAQPPYNTLHLKIFYPSQNVERKIGSFDDDVPVDTQLAPFPVVIFLNGFKCGMEMYQWLAVKLVELGLVVVTFSWIEEYFPHKIGQTPGINLKAWQPDTYGKVPSSSLLPTILTELENLNKQGFLAGLLNLEKIILGGHSAGGRLAIENANPGFFPQIVAAFSYGTQTIGPVVLGFEPNTILPLPDQLPLLLMGGSKDISLSYLAATSGVMGDPITPVRRTFEEGLTGGRNDSYFLIFEGANHFCICDPLDGSLKKSFFDLNTTPQDEEFRLLMVELISLFIKANVYSLPEAFQALDHWLATPNPLITCFERK